jgi:hypothetical protein
MDFGVLQELLLKDVIFSKDYIFIGRFSKEVTPFCALISKDNYNPKQLHCKFLTSL